MVIHIYTNSRSLFARLRANFDIEVYLTLLCLFSKDGTCTTLMYVGVTSM